jgi:uncharacterized protein
MKNRHSLVMDMDIELQEGDLEIHLEPDDPVLAADKRTVTVDGRLIVEGCNISAARANPYFGREIPNYQELGLGADSIYMIYRHPKALAAAAASFEAVPLMLTHVSTSAADPQKDLIAGTVSNVRYRHPMLIADIAVWSDDAIRVIEDESQRELSSAYRYRVKMQPGRTPEGEAYDGFMVPGSIIGNHVALVETGRAGPDVMVKDSAI